MKCSEVLREISEYACGELPEDRACDIRAHIEGCDSCRKEFEFAAALRSRVREYLHSPVEVSDMTDSVMANLPVERKPRLCTSRWVWAGGVCAAAALVLSLYFGNVEPVDVETAVVPIDPPEIEVVVEEIEPEPAIVPAPEAKPAPRPSRPVARKPAPVPESEPAVEEVIPAEREPEAKAQVPEEPELETELAEEPPTENIADSRAPAVSIRHSAGMSVVIEIRDIEVKYTSDRKFVTLPPNEDAANIERPPLEVVQRPSPIIMMNGS